MKVNSNRHGVDPATLIQRVTVRLGRAIRPEITQSDASLDVFKCGLLLVFYTVFFFVRQPFVHAI